MNVLQIVPELNAGGVERTAIEVAGALSAAGHGAHVASAGGRLEGELRAAGGVLHMLPMATKNPLAWGGNAKALEAIIGEHAIDIVHARSRAPAFAARTAAKAAGVRWMTTYHGIYNAPDGMLGAPKRAYNAVMASGEVVIANSGYTAAHIMAEHGTEEARIRVVPRGVDMARFDPARIAGSARQAVRAEWGVRPGETVWLLPGRLTRWKGQEVAIRALALVDNARLILMGDLQGRESYGATLATMMAERGVAGRVSLHAHSADMPLMMAASDVVLSASTDPEAFGRVAAEAQAMGKPVVATAHGGALETVEDGVTGRLVAPGDAKALAEGCEEVAEWPKRTYARERISRLYSDSRMTSDVLQIYGGLLARYKSSI